MRALVGLALTAALFAACSKPATEVKFISAKDAADSLYRFTLDMTDSLASYSVYFFSRTDRPATGGERSFPMTLDAEWISPDGETELKETVYLNSSPAGGSKDLYRSDVRPAPGEWTLSVRVSGAPKGFRGLGIISERQDGTR